MAKEYIEREALLSAFGEEPMVWDERDDAEVQERFDWRRYTEIVKSAPAADVVEVVHGRWIPCDPDSDVRFYCSECGTEISTSWDYDCDEMWNGCPHCLARMDGEK